VVLLTNVLIKSLIFLGSPTGPPTSGPFVDSDNTFTITITSQSGSSFSGSGTKAESDGSESTNITFSGPVDTATIYTLYEG